MWLQRRLDLSPVRMRLCLRRRFYAILQSGFGLIKDGKYGNTSPIAIERPPVAVIILNWNGRKLLEEYLPQVIAASDPAVSRIIVADNGSTDDSVDYLENNFGGAVEIMAFDKNYGFAEGYNKAIDLCSDYEYSVLLNSDVARSADGIVRFMLLWRKIPIMPDASPNYWHTRIRSASNMQVPVAGFWTATDIRSVAAVFSTSARQTAVNTIPR